MIRVLLIARYHDPTMSRKLDLLAAHSDVMLWHICPRHWRDELIQTQLATKASTYRQAAIEIARPSDPHRALYHTLTFGLSDFSPDIIHAEEEPDSLPALQIAFARRLFASRAKLLLNTWQNVDRPLKRSVRWVMNIALRASDGIMCANTAARDLLRQRGYNKLVEVLPAIGVDTRVFAPGFRQEREPVTIAYIGRLVAEKGIDTLIGAIKQINQSGVAQPLKLQIIGDGPYRSEIVDQATSVGHWVEFSAPMLPAQIAQALQQIDALVLPSRTTPVWKEQFGRVLIEAMACKTPVIGSDSGAIPEVIGDAGLIFPEGNATALATCLRRLIDSPALRADLAERGYARVLKHYTQERIAQRTLELYRQLVPPTKYGIMEQGKIKGDKRG
jgi:glycosyltransferase involved in cell wall biosynthesis